MRVISRYTANGHYPTLAATLTASCDRFGIAHDVQEVSQANGKNPRDAWQRTMYGFTDELLRALLQERGPICWMDCDCEIVQTPRLMLDAREDFAIYNWHADRENVGRVPYDPTKLLGSGGVIMFGYTAPAIELLIEWSSCCNARLHKHDQHDSTDVLTPWDQMLDLAWKMYRPPVNPLWLPKEYNRMTSHFPNVAPVINHVFKDGGHAGQPAAFDLKCTKCGAMVKYDDAKTIDGPFGAMPACVACARAVMLIPA